MISSPCKSCYRRNRPKDECLKECKLLHQWQDLHLAKAEITAYTAVDYTEESRFSIVLPMTSPSAP
jgi:hypothetical protein